MGDETLIDILQEEGGQPIFNNAVLRRLQSLEDHAKTVDDKIDVIERYQIPLREIMNLASKFLIYICAMAILGLVLSEVSGINDLSTIVGP